MADGGEGWREAAEAAGQAVVDRRVKMGYRTRAQFADDIKLTTKTLGQVERGERPSYDRSTYATLDQALEWAAGTFEALLKGERVPAAQPEVVDLSVELMTAVGVHQNLFVPRVELAYLIHESDLGPEDRFEVIKYIRLKQAVFDKDLAAEVAEEIRRRTQRAG